jgi:hypothetical protein
MQHIIKAQCFVGLKKYDGLRWQVKVKQKQKLKVIDE